MSSCLMFFVIICNLESIMTTLFACFIIIFKKTVLSSTFFSGKKPKLLYPSHQEKTSRALVNFCIQTLKFFKKIGWKNQQKYVHHKYIIRLFLFTYITCFTSCPTLLLFTYPHRTNKNK